MRLPLRFRLIMLLFGISNRLIQLATWVLNRANKAMDRYNQRYASLR